MTRYATEIVRIAAEEIVTRYAREIVRKYVRRIVGRKRLEKWWENVQEDVMIYMSRYVTISIREFVEIRVRELVRICKYVYHIYIPESCQNLSKDMSR